MFSFVSALKTSINWCESMPATLQSAPTSLANDTLSAWKALSTYLDISAIATGTWKVGPAKSAYSDEIVAMSASSVPPTTVLGGAKKSLTEEPSRRNSGCTHTPKSTPATRPDAASSRGTTTRSHVPGSIVERTATMYRRSVGSAAPISSATRSRKLVESDPFGADGVPTQMNATSLDRTDSATDVVARSRPAATPSATRSPMRSSRTGLCPRLTMSTLASFTSTPTTSWPISARHAADTMPT